MPHSEADSNRGTASRPLGSSNPARSIETELWNSNDPFELDVCQNRLLTASFVVVAHDWPASAAFALFRSSSGLGRLLP